MRKLNCIFIVNIVFIVLLGCSEDSILPESIDSDETVSMKSDKVDKFVPFKGTFEVKVDKVLHLPPPPPKVQEVIGEGNVTHLGKTEVYIKQWWLPPNPPILIPPYTGTGWGDIIFTAANGDLLLAEYKNAEAYHETETLVFVTFTGYFKDGGTGRFKNAEGSFIWEVIFNPKLNSGTTTLTGEIMYHK